MNKEYWHQRASTWVSAAVLAGGLTTAVILVVLFRFQSKLDAANATSASAGASDQWTQELDRRGY